MEKEIHILRGDQYIYLFKPPNALMLLEKYGDHAWHKEKFLFVASSLRARCTVYGAS